MAELKKVRLALKYAIRRSQETFLLEGKDWEIFDGLVGILLNIIKDFGYSVEETTALYEEVKEEVEKELKKR